MTREMKAHFLTKRLNRIDTLLGTEEGKPSVAGRDVSKFIAVDDIKCFHAFGIALPRKLGDCLRVDIESTCLVYEMHNCEPRSKGMRGLDCRGPERCVDREQTIRYI